LCHRQDRRRLLIEADRQIGRDAGGEQALDNLREDQLAVVRFCEDLANGFDIGGLSDHVSLLIEWEVCAGHAPARAFLELRAMSGAPLR
jgi:hypothetical protein